MRCKPGDLAVVINDHNYPANNGAFVRVIGPATCEDYGDEPRDWDCQPLQALWGRCIRTGRPLCNMENTEFDDDELQPIRPDAEPESTTTPRELEAA